MKDQGQRIYILLSIGVLSLVVTLVDAFLKPNYILKVLIKIFFFLVIPLFFFAWNKKEFIKFKKLFFLKRKTMCKAILIGIGIYITIVGGYFISRNFVDFSHVSDTLKEKHGITANNFLYVALYISLLNSFLEEFFFRGFGFITLKPYVNRVFAYLFNPIFFAIYHAGMLIGMFDWYVLLLLFVGLFAGGCIFNYLNESGENIYASWASHMFSNFAINTVGFILLKGF